MKPRLSREVIVLGLIAFFVMVGFGVVIPVLPVFVRSFDVGYTEVGAVISAFALMRLVASPFCGKLIDWGGERTILAVGIGIVAVSSAMVGIAQSYLEVLLLRGAGGIGSAMFSISAMTLLLGTTDRSMRGRAVGFYQGGFLIGGMAGPALGGLLAIISLRAPFFFYAGTLLVAGAVGLAFLRPSSGEVAEAASEPVPVIRLRDRCGRANSRAGSRGEVRRHGRASPGHHRGVCAGRRGDGGHPVRRRHLDAYGTALRLRHRRGLHGYRSRRRRRRCRRRSKRAAGRNIFRVFRPRRHRRPARRRRSTGCPVVPSRIRIGRRAHAGGIRLRAADAARSPVMFEPV